MKKASTVAQKTDSAQGGGGLRLEEREYGTPNIVYMLIDDLGYGDVQYLNPEGRIPTPHMDRLAREGMIFTDAHSNSAVCTPTRYGINTGRYCWRSPLQKSVLWDYEESIVKPDRLTVGKMLQQCGYSTAAFGKWHLGMTWATKDGAKALRSGSNVDFDQPFQNGPRDLGFDYYYGVQAINMGPYCFMENDRTVGIPNVPMHSYGSWKPEALKIPGYELDQALPTITQKAVEYIDARTSEEKPFFLYFPATSVHGPVGPSLAKEWMGRSEMTAYSDLVMQTDWSVGQILQALDRNGLWDDTIVIFTSDNGCAPNEVFALEKYLHDPSYVFRGYKFDLFEGGHHIPYIIRWPGKIEAGSVCNDTICLTDLMATVADILDYELPDDAAEDSFTNLPDLLGIAKEPVREGTVYHSFHGFFSIQERNWKLILHPWSGGYKPPDNIDIEKLPAIQLYDMGKDISETRNLEHRYPNIVKRLKALLQSYFDQGRSTPGEPQKNDEDKEGNRFLSDLRGD